MKTRTVVAAATYSTVYWLALAFGLFASGVRREPVSPWVLVFCAVSLTGWLVLLLRRSPVFWWALVGTYSLTLFLIALRLRLTSSDPEALEMLSYALLRLGLCLTVLACVPLLLLTTDRPGRWNILDQRSTSIHRMLWSKAGTSVILISIIAIISFSFYENPPARRAQEDNIRESVLRYQFRHNGSGIQENAGAYYVSLYNEGVEQLSPAKEFALVAHALVFGEPGVPSGRFIRRFTGHKPPVKKVSQCIREVGGVTDRKTDRRGLVLSAGVIKWIDDRTVEVKGGYYEGGLSASWNTYRVTRKNGAWIVVSDRLDAIS